MAIDYVYWGQIIPHQDCVSFACDNSFWCHFTRQHSDPTTTEEELKEDPFHLVRIDWLNREIVVVKKQNKIKRNLPEWF